jgi:glutamyl-tRNA reductase
MLGIIGISYKSAPLEIREKYSFTDEEALRFIQQLQIDPDLKGVVVLSTCNRIEIYFECEKCSENKANETFFRNLEFFKKTDFQERKYFYSCQGDMATEHLFRVVSGLESLVLGEDQIVTQTKSSFKLSLDNNFCSPILTRMFNKAFEAGKRVRTETAINQGSASISTAAVELLYKVLPDIQSKKILLIGTGVMGKLAAINLVNRDCKSLLVTNRTFSKAKELAAKHGILAFEIERLHEYLPQCDVILVATGAQNHIINKQMVQAYSNQYQHNQLFIDLSVPRNICTDIQELPFVKLFAVDDLQEIVKDTKNRRSEAISDAVEIIQFVKQEFNDWLCALDLTPSIKKIKKSMEAVNLAELDGFLRINGIIDHEMIARYADHISRKYARLFIRNLKQVTDNGKQREYVNLVNRLFELQTKEDTEIIRSEET